VSSKPRTVAWIVSPSTTRVTWPVRVAALAPVLEAPSRLGGVGFVAAEVTGALGIQGSGPSLSFSLGI
jgi:hypothetical protein